MITRGQLLSELFRQHIAFDVFRKTVRIQIATRHWLRTAIRQTGMLLLYKDFIFVEVNFQYIRISFDLPGQLNSTVGRM